MLNQLLETIIQILTGWLNKFDSHAQHVEDKLDSLDQTASDIETNTEPISDIADNTGAVVTPIQNIKSNTDSIKQSSQTSANNTTAILNNISTLSTNTGRAAAFAEDCANNTLDIKNRIVTIGSDTTQLRSNSNTITSDVSDIKTALNYYLANTPVTEDVEGSICNIDTDLTDYLQACNVTIPSDLTGFSGITLTKNGKNLININGTVNIENKNPGEVVTLVNGMVIKGIARNGYLRPTNVTTTINGDSITVTSTNDVYGVGYVFACTEGQKYCFSSSTANTRNACAFYGSNGIFISGSGFNTGTQVYTVPENVVYGIIIIYPSAVNTPTTYSKLQLESGDTATAYEPYKAITYPVSFGTTITDGAEINLLDGIIKVNSTPVSYLSVSPIAVRTYKGVNNIYSDVGTTALTYRETLKHYLDKNNQ